MNEILKRLQSKVVWLGVIAQVVLIMTLVDPNNAPIFKAIATAFVEICTLFGILNNPSDRENF